MKKCKKHKYNKNIVYGNCIMIGNKYIKPLEIACICGSRRKLTKKEIELLKKIYRELSKVNRRCYYVEVAMVIAEIRKFFELEEDAN